jgi:translation elongation factor EF-1alpha
MSEEVQPIAQVTHYFGKISVGILHLYDALQLGDWIHFYGNKTNFIQEVTSMEINHQRVEEAYAGDEIGLEVADKVRKGDWVYLTSPPEE